MLKKKYFSRYREPVAHLPNLAEVQVSSYDWLVKTGLREIFDEFSPTLDYTEQELALDFLDYTVDEPRYDENYVRINNLSLEAPLRVRVR